MTWTPAIYVDFNRRDPRRANRFYASLHRIEYPELGRHVRATDYEEFDVEAVIVGIDHLSGLVVLDVVDENSVDEGARGMRVEMFSPFSEGDQHEGPTVDHANLESIAP